MKQHIAIEWYKSDGRSEPEEMHFYHLSARALEGVEAGIQQGSISGHLKLNMVELDDGGDPEEYRGSWELRTRSSGDSQFFVVTGRIPGDDKDTCMMFKAQDRNHAIEQFRDCLWVDEDEDKRAEIKSSYQTDLYVGTVISSEHPMQIS